MQTIDFFTPIVADPYLFGQIAAANALSDVYAMGGRPLTALNLLTFNPATLAPAAAGEILRGGADKVAEAGAVIVGGHTVEDDTVKYGLSVTGLVHPERVWTNAGARAGDALILTKPLGTGIITTAMSAGLASDDAERAAVASMAGLNGRAAELAAACSVHGATDITGFGLLGHLAELAQASGVDVELSADRVPLLPDVEALAGDGLLPAGLYRNQAHFEPLVTFAPGLPQAMRDILYDPQTSGGLLLAVPAAEAAALCRELQTAGLVAAEVARAVSGTGRIKVDNGR